MEALRIQRRPLPSEVHLMNTISANFRTTLGLRWGKLRVFCSSSPNLTTTQDPKSVKVRDKVSDAKLKENWLNSLTYPFPPASNTASEWVIGIDPDVSGALALLKTDHCGCSAQVFDSPHLKVLVGKTTRRRLDAKSMIELLRSFEAPVGTKAYLEQSIPYPRDGKQGWWSGGFNYGIWIGVLVASGFSVVPIPSLLWKNEYKLSGNGSSKDDSRKVASTLFPCVSSMLKRKKDHGRAEALLIAAYGKGLKINSHTSCTLQI